MASADAWLPGGALVAAFGSLASHGAISVEAVLPGGARATALLLTRGSGSGPNPATGPPDTARVALAAPSRPALASAAAALLAAARGGGQPGRDDGGGGTFRYLDPSGAARGPFPFTRLAAWAAARFWPPGFLVQDCASGSWLSVELAVAAGRVLAGEAPQAAAAAAWPGGGGGPEGRPRPLPPPAPGGHGVFFPQDADMADAAAARDAVAAARAPGGPLAGLPVEAGRAVAAAVAAAARAGGGGAMDVDASALDAARRVLTRWASADAAPLLTGVHAPPPPASITLVLDTNVLLTRASLVLGRVREGLDADGGGGGGAGGASPHQPPITFLIPWVVVGELDRIKDRRAGGGVLADLAPAARAALATLSREVATAGAQRPTSVRVAVEPLATARAGAARWADAAPRGSEPPGADDLILACCLEAAAGGGPGAATLLVTLDRGLALRAGAAGIGVVEPRDLPRSRAGMAEVAGRAAAVAAAAPAACPPPAQPLRSPSPPLPALDAASVATLAADLDDALLTGLGTAAAACLAATHGAGVWTELVPDPPPWTGPGGTSSVLACVRATFSSSIADFYGPGKGARARAARDAADALAKARSAAGRRGGGGSGSRSVAALRAVLRPALDLLSDFPTAGDAAAAAALASARAVAGRVAAAVGLA